MLARAIRRSIPSSATLHGSPPRPPASSPVMRKARSLSSSRRPRPRRCVASPDDLRGQIAAHAIARGALARRDRKIARLRLGGEFRPAVKIRSAGRRSTRTRWLGGGCRCERRSMCWTCAARGKRRQQRRRRHATLRAYARLAPLHHPPPCGRRGVLPSSRLSLVRQMGHRGPAHAPKSVTTVLKDHAQTRLFHQCNRIDVSPSPVGRGVVRR